MFVREPTPLSPLQVTPSIDRLEQRVLAAHTRLAGAQHELCLAVAAHARSGGHRLDGARDEAEWLARRLALEPATARRIAELAERLDDLPALASAFAAGELSIDQAAATAAFAAPELDEAIAEAARGLTPAQIERLGDELFPPEAEDDAKIARERRLDLRWTDRRRVLRISGRLPFDQGLILEGAIRRLAEQHLPALEEGADAGSYGTRCADALVTLAEAANGAESPEPERATVILHLRAGEAPHLEHAGVISRAAAERLACDSRLQAIVTDGGGNAHATRARRTAPDALVRVLRDRDRSCRFPGCSATRHLASHHRQWWAANGPTARDNLVLLCGRHHRFVHELGWAVSGPSNALRFLRPDGTVCSCGPPAHAPPGSRRAA